MLSVILVLLFCTVIQESHSEWNMRPPHHPPWSSTWVNGLVNTALTKLTTEIYRDAFTKMKTVKSNGVIYQKGSMFAIGIIAANMYGLFDKMIKIYQDVSNLQKTRDQGWEGPNSLKDSVMAFGICQSLYHQIRLEKKLFEELLQKQAEEQKKKMDEFTSIYGPIPAGGPVGPKLHKGGMYVQRRSNFDDLFDVDDFDSNFELPLLSKRNTKQTKASNQQTRGQLVDQKPGANMHVPRNPYALSPPNARQSDHLNMQKPAGPFAFPIPDVSKILPIVFPKPPSNSSILKLMAQLNKDNPHLNRDLDAYLRRNRRGYRAKPDGNDADKLSMAGLDSYPVQSRRSGLNRNLRTQPPKLASNSYTFQSQRIGSEKNPKTQPPKFVSNSYSFQSRRMGSDSYFTPQQPSLGSANYRTSQPPKRSSSHPKYQQTKFDAEQYYPVKRLRLHPDNDYGPDPLRRMGSESYFAVQQPHRSNSYRALLPDKLEPENHRAVQPKKRSKSHLRIQQPKFGTDIASYYSVKPLRLHPGDDYGPEHMRRMESDSYFAAQQPWLESNSDVPAQPPHRPSSYPKNQQPRLDSDSYFPVQRLRLHPSDDYELKAIDYRGLFNNDASGKNRKTRAKRL